MSDARGRSPRRRPLWVSSAVVLLAAPSRAQDGTDDAVEMRAGGIEPAHVAAALDDIASRSPPDFCRRASYRLAGAEAALCSLAPAARARCPEFAAACERAAGNAPRPPEAPQSDSAWLAWIAGLLRLLGLALLAALAGLCLLALWRLLRTWLGPNRRRRREAAQVGPAAAPAGPVVDQAAAGAEAHLARARALAVAGDPARALVELHLGVVASLDARGALRARPGRTNGDYARELARRPELSAAFGELTRAVEAVQFGGARVDAGGFERWLGRAAPLLGTLLPVLLGGWLSLGSIGCDGEPRRPAPSEACGTGANGNSLLCAILEANGSTVRRRYRPLDELGRAGDDAPDVIVLLPAELEAAAARALEAWVRSGGVLLLTTPLPELDRQLGVERSDRACGGAAALAGSPHTLVTIGPGFVAGELETSALCPSGDAFIARGPLGDGWVGVVPTAAALSNASLVAADNAATIVPLLFPAVAVVELAGRWTRSEAENPLTQLRAAGLLPWVLQLMALGLSYGLYRGQPFARRRAAPEPGRRRFSEHAQALGQRWAEAGAAGAALKAYAGWATEQLRERLPAGTEPTVPGLAQVISEKTGKPAEAVARTLERARRAQFGAPADAPLGAAPTPRELPDEAEQLSTLKALGRLLDEIGGPH